MIRFPSDVNNAADAVGIEMTFCYLRLIYAEWKAAGYCYVKPIYSNNALSKETADEFISFVLRNILPEQGLTVNFHGGEPLLNYDIIKYLVERLKTLLPTKELRFGLTTNGSLLDKEKISYLAENMKYNLSISIDGKKETMEKNRKCISGKIDYDQIENNALSLLEKHPGLRIRMTYDRKNVDELCENIKYFIQKGFRYIVPVADEYADDWTENDYEKIREQFIFLRNWMKNNNIDDVKIDVLSGCFRELGKCTAGDHYYSIDVFGNIFPCTVLVGHDEWQIGSLKQGLDKKMLKRIKDINEPEIVECSGCGLYDYCISTRCRFINYATTGNYFTPNIVACNMLGIKAELC